MAGSLTHLLFLREIHRKSPKIANHYGDSRWLRRSVFSMAGSFCAGNQCHPDAVPQLGPPVGKCQFCFSKCRFSAELRIPFDFQHCTQNSGHSAATRDKNLQFRAFPYQNLAPRHYLPITTPRPTLGPPPPFPVLFPSQPTLGGAASGGATSLVVGGLQKNLKSVCQSGSQSSFEGRALASRSGCGIWLPANIIRNGKAA